jgi:hypothetical protein
MNPETLGIDIGGVIIEPTNSKSDTSFLTGDHLRTPAQENALETIRALALHRFGEHIYLVSKCGPRVQARTREWLAAQEFYERASVAPSRVHFCLRRDEKASICEALGITHFIDDRLEVLSYMVAVPNLYLFRPRDSEVANFAEHLARVTRVESWNEVRQALLL